MNYTITLYLTIILLISNVLLFTSTFVSYHIHPQGSVGTLLYSNQPFSIFVSLSSLFPTIHIFLAFISLSFYIISHMGNLTLSTPTRNMNHLNIYSLSFFLQLVQLLYTTLIFFSQSTHPSQHYHQCYTHQLFYWSTTQLYQPHNITL